MVLHPPRGRTVLSQDGHAEATGGFNEFLVASGKREMRSKSQVKIKRIIDWECEAAGKLDVATVACIKIDWNACDVSQ